MTQLLSSLLVLSISPEYGVGEIEKTESTQAWNVSTQIMPEIDDQTRLFGVFTPKVKGDPFITETSTSITIDNVHYKAVIDKTSGSFGGIKDFYIKPYTTVDIVASNTNFDVMGGHEWADYDTSTELSQFGGEATNTEISILKSTATYALIYSKFDLENASTSQAKTIEEWKTFFHGKPYFQVTYKATYNSDILRTYNNEICFLFENAWVEQLVFLNGTGQIETVNKPSGTTLIRNLFNPQGSMEIASAYSWGAYYNSTYGKYFGTIITGLQPRFPAMVVKWDIFGSGVSNQYSEYQITPDFGTGLRYSGYQYWGSYINYVTSDYHDISAFAQNLYSTTYTNETMNTLWTWTDNGENYNQLIGSPLWSIYKFNNVAYPFIIVLKNGWEDSMEVSVKITPKFRNASGQFKIWNWASVSIYERYNSTTEANVTYTMRYEDSWRVNMTFQFYNDTEIMIVKGYWKTLKDLNITRVEWDVGIDDTPPDRYYLNDTMIVQDNSTNSNSYSGFAVVNKTFYDRQSGSPNDFFWRIYGATPFSVSEGTEYNMEYWFQPYRRRSSEDKFTTTDFLQLHESDLKNYRNNWINLFNANDMRIKDFIDENTNLLYHNLNGETLDLVLYADSGGTTTTEIYVGDKGKPTGVSGATSWSYDALTKIVTVTVTHSSSQEVIIDWTVKIPGDVNGDGVVDISDLARIGKAYGSTPADPKWDELCDMTGPAGVPDDVIDIYDLDLCGKNYGKTV